MGLYESLDIAQAVSGRLDVLWGFFVTVHLAILGGIIYVDRPLRSSEKLVAILLYAGFALMSFKGMMFQLQILSHLFRDIVSFKTLPCCGDIAIIDLHISLLEAGYFTSVRWVALGAHVAASLVVVLLIIRDQARAR